MGGGQASQWDDTSLVWVISRGVGVGKGKPEPSGAPNQSTRNRSAFYSIRHCQLIWTPEMNFDLFACGSKRAVFHDPRDSRFKRVLGNVLTCHAVNTELK